MRARTCAAATALALGAGGCGGDGSSASPSVEEPPSGASSSLTPTVPLPEPSETVDPASGPQLDVEGIRVNAPARWKQTYDTIVVDTAQGRDGSLMLSAASTMGDQLSLEQAERYFWTRSRKPKGYTPQDSVVMGRLTASYYTITDRFGTSHVVTMWDAGYAIKVDLTLEEEVPAEEQREVLDSVLASYESPRTAG